MKTVKLQISNNPDVLNDMRIFSSMVRIAFNRFQDGHSEKQITEYLNARFVANCWIVHSAIKEAHSLFDSQKDTKIIFGGKLNFKKYLKGLITKEQFKYNRWMPVCSTGQANQRGNRLINFSLDDNYITYKPNQSIHKVIRFCPVKKKLAHELSVVQELVEQKKMPVTVKFTDKHLYLTYDESLICNEAYKGLKYNRVLGIDMNPNYIGVSVIEFDKDDKFKVLHKEVYDLTALTKSSGKASSDKKSKYLTHKLKHETLAIAHKINRLVDYWKCSKLAVEDLFVNIENKKKRTSSQQSMQQQVGTPTLCEQVEDVG